MVQLIQWHEDAAGPELSYSGGEGRKLISLSHNPFFGESLSGSPFF